MTNYGNIDRRWHYARRTNVWLSLARQSVIYLAMDGRRGEPCTEYQIRRNDRVEHMYKHQWHNNGVRRTLRQLEKRGLIVRCGQLDSRPGREHRLYRLR